MRHLFFVLLIPIFFLPVQLLAQEIPGEQYRFEEDALSRIRNNSDFGGQITVSMDPFVEENYYKHILYNSRRPGDRKSVV